MALVGWPTSPYGRNVRRRIACDPAPDGPRHRPVGRRPAGAGLVLTLATVLTLGAGCGGDEATEPAASGAPEPPDLATAMAVELDDQRPDILATLGGPDAFRLAFVPVEGGTVRHEIWDYLELGTRLEFVDGELVFTTELEPPEDGAWYPVHLAPSEFAAGMSPEDVREQLAGVDLEEVDLSEATGEGGLALVGGQVLIAFAGDELVAVETFPLVPDPDSEFEDVLEAVTP
jgi:hypothetical protein